MAFLLGCEKASFSYPVKEILNCQSFGVSEGDRIGIVGPNGEGKSSLLGILSGTLELDEGRLTKRGGVKVGVLDQNCPLDLGLSVQQAVVGDIPEYEWASRADVRAIIQALLPDVEWEKKLGELSGGQRRRCDLARLLVGDWDVLLLDEPTNHLDIEGIAWLAQHLKTRWRANQGALLMVTHDRWFLDEVCLNMWELHDGIIDPFEGGYSAYVQQRLERDRQSRVVEQKRQNLLRKELAWLSRGAPARTSKPKFRLDAARELIASEPPLRNEIELKQMAMQRLGKQVIELDGVSKTQGDKQVLKNVDWIIGPGDRVGIIGENGAGKTTLLHLLDASLEPTSGTIKRGKTVKLAFLSQHLDELAQYDNERVLDCLKHYKTRYVVDGRELSPGQMLERLGFKKEHLLNFVKDLSGGQRRRLQFMLMLLDEPNVIILDEPGNDLDTDMLAVMESLLDAWPGTLIIVTHDRYFMERVTDNQYALINGKLRHLPGGVDEYLDISRAAQGTQAAFISPAVQKSQGETSSQSGLGAGEIHQIKKQMNSLMRRISTLESKIDKAKAALHDLDPTDFEALGEAQAKINELNQEKEALEEEWMELAEQVEG